MHQEAAQEFLSGKLHCFDLLTIPIVFIFKSYDSVLVRYDSAFCNSYSVDVTAEILNDMSRIASGLTDFNVPLLVIGLLNDVIELPFIEDFIQYEGSLSRVMYSPLNLAARALAGNKNGLPALVDRLGVIHSPESVKAPAQKMTWI